jgi:ABC-type nitrate/sulfonate/bicarbonate transport system substrate-binding protein
MMINDGANEVHFKEVVLQTAGFEVLAKHRVDWTTLFGGVDDVQARLEGIKLRLFYYKDYLGPNGNAPDIEFFASDSAIAEKADLLRRGLRALSKGYTYSARHPDQAAQILIQENKSSLGKSKTWITASSREFAKTLLDRRGRWGCQTPQQFMGLGQALAKGRQLKDAKGKPVTPTRYSQFFTNDLLSC